MMSLWISHSNKIWSFF